MDGSLTLFIFFIFKFKMFKQVNLKGISDPAGVFFCSGSLISDLYVLIAAQCLAKYSNFI